MRRAGQNPTDIEEEKDFYLSLFYLFIKQLIGPCRPSGKFNFFIELLSIG
jgi:hypothetical protein